MDILIIDDDRAVCASLGLLLKRAGYSAHSIHQPDALDEALRRIAPRLVLLDMNFSIETSGRQGLALLRRLREARPDVPVVLMTGWATVQLAVEGMKLGASDFIAKPWDNQHLLRSVRTLIELSQPKAEAASLGKGFAHLVGEDAAFLEVLRIAQKVSATNASVLITGESGTGKELIAEAIHYASPRAGQPFVKVNLGGISSSLFESEMFGHKRGAFTDAVADRQGRFELANGGSIFLDEIGELGLDSQVKLLRVLQEQTFEALGSSRSQRIDVRVISATNKDLGSMVRQGSFREDLFYRINLIQLHLPALRERPADIPRLARFYVDSLRKNYGVAELSISSEALDWLRGQRFPGNVRQLKNLIERCFLMANGSQLGLAEVQRHYSDGGAPSGPALPEGGLMSLEALEKSMIARALRYHDNNISAAAQALGITRGALYRRLEKYGLS